MDFMLTLQLKYVSHVLTDVNYAKIVHIYHVLNAVLIQPIMCPIFYL